MILVEHDRSSAQGATAVDSAIDLALMARNGFSTQRLGKVAQLKGQRQLIQLEGQGRSRSSKGNDN